MLYYVNFIYSESPKMKSSDVQGFEIALDPCTIHQVFSAWEEKMFLI